MAQTTPRSTHQSERYDNGDAVAVAECPPQVDACLESAIDAAFYATKQRTVTIYRSTGDRIVALIEIVSPSNKHSQFAIDKLNHNVAVTLDHQYHLLLIDAIRPGRHNPLGMTSKVWDHISGELWEPPADRPLSMASFCASDPLRAYITSLDVGSALADMPLFLTREHYINVPMEATCAAAYRGVTQRWRRVIQS